MLHRKVVVMLSRRRMMKSAGRGIAIVVGIVGFAAVAGAAPPADDSRRGFERWRAARIEVFMNDFGELGRYRKQNERLGPPAPGDRRVVFLGDSITDDWPLATYFPGKPYVNRGIGGQTTSQMLVRFHQDVNDLQPKAVVILSGTNDLAGNTGPIRLGALEANYASLAQLAAASGITTIFASILPVHDYTPAAREYFAARPPARIVQINGWLRSYCAAHGCIYLDYFSHLIDAHGRLMEHLAGDGLHPNEAGYQIMAPLAEAAIRTALAGRP